MYMARGSCWSGPLPHDVAIIVYYSVLTVPPHSWNKPHKVTTIHAPISCYVLLPTTLMISLHKRIEGIRDLELYYRNLLLLGATTNDIKLCYDAHLLYVLYQYHVLFWSTTHRLLSSRHISWVRVMKSSTDLRISFPATQTLLDSSSITVSSTANVSRFI